MSKVIMAVIAALLPALVAAQPAGELYAVRLRELAAVDEPEVVAAQIAAAARGEVVHLEGSVALLRLSPAEARMVAADPRVAAVTLSATTVAAETMPWTTGVAYQYDGSGNIKKIGTDVFLYDAAGRLVQSDTTGIRRNYGYDAYGNRSKCRESEGTPAEGDCQYGFTATATTNRLSGVAHDAAGNVTALGAYSFAYDAMNMQTRATSSSVVREYVYTADDERLATYTVGGGWRWTVRDTAGKILREFTSTDGPSGPGTANWQWLKDYIWRDGLLLASRQREGATTTTYHYHLDHLGTPRRITDNTDRIVGTHDYFPFGTEASGGRNEPSLSLLKFTGHERDLILGESWDTLDYLHARFESPTFGRFLSPDAGKDWDLAKPQSWNLYAYVRNNPVNLIDPSGECGEAPEFIGPTVPCDIEVVAENPSDLVHVLWYTSETTAELTPFGPMPTPPSDPWEMWAMYQAEQNPQPPGPDHINMGFPPLPGRLKGPAVTEPTLPPKIISTNGRVTFEHNYRSNDHGPAHAHVHGGGDSTRIRQNGGPYPGDAPMTAAQRAAYEANKSVIRRAINKIGRWLDYHGF